MCSTSASVLACATRKSAAAMKENSIIRPKKVKVKNTLTRKVPKKNTKLAIALLKVSNFYRQSRVNMFGATDMVTLWKP